MSLNSFMLPAIRWQGFGPRQQSFYEVSVGLVHVLRNLRKQIFEVFVYIKIVGLSRLDDAVDDRTGIGSAQSKNASTSGFTSFFRFFFRSDGGSFLSALSVW